MDDNEPMWDRLAGTLMNYVDNYYLQQEINNREQNGETGLYDGFPLIEPSYEVDYEISESILEYLRQTLETGNIDDIWYLTIGTAYQNINDFPPELKKLTVQFLPRFFAQFPEYEAEECLRVSL